MSLNPSMESLVKLVESSMGLVVLTGAGCSTGSGIPDYRDAVGDWKRAQPIQYGEFTQDPIARRRYWARSMHGWGPFMRAKPNLAHHALARLESAGRVRHLITQNVDRLHSAAGSVKVTDLHGRLDEVRCLECEHRIDRASIQDWLEATNAGWIGEAVTIAPDGDADLGDASYERFQAPSCPRCGGILKPDVVFFGESVPRDCVQRAYDEVAGADALLVVGTSLMVFSGYRFVREAVRREIPVAAINLGRTRADDALTFKIEADAGEALAGLLLRMGIPR